MWVPVEAVMFLMTPKHHRVITTVNFISLLPDGPGKKDSRRNRMHMSLIPAKSAVAKRLMVQPHYPYRGKTNAYSYTRY